MDAYLPRCFFGRGAKSAPASEDAKNKKSVGKRRGNARKNGKIKRAGGKAAPREARDEWNKGKGRETGAASGDKGVKKWGEKG